MLLSELQWPFSFLDNKSTLLVYLLHGFDQTWSNKLIKDKNLKNKNLNSHEHFAVQLMWGSSQSAQHYCQLCLNSCVI
jgi:hypothetical protein